MHSVAGSQWWKYHLGYTNNMYSFCTWGDGLQRSDPLSWDAWIWEWVRICIHIHPDSGSAKNISAAGALGPAGPAASSPPFSSTLLGLAPGVNLPPCLGSTVLFLLFYVVIFLAMRHVGSELPNQGLNPHPLEDEVLTTGPLRKSLTAILITVFSIVIGGISDRNLGIL